MALFNGGVDVVSFQVASTAVMQAAQERGRMAIAYHSDMRKDGPDAQLLAVTHQWGDYYTARAKAVLDGSWKSQDTWGGVREGMIRVEGFGPKLPPAVREEVLQRQRTWPRAACSPSRPATSRCATTRARCAFQPASSWTMHRSCR